MLRRERTIEVDLDKTDLLATGIHIFDDFGSRFGDRTHRDDDSLRFRIADIDEWSIGSASSIGNLLEVFASDIDNLRFVDILSFTALESDIVVFRTASGDRMSMRVESSLLEVGNRFLIE